MSEREPVGGWATTFEGQRVPLSSDDVKAIWDACEKADARRREAMPDSMAAIRHLQDALTRLNDEGWRHGIYCPKDGSPFAVIEFGSTGIFQGWYHGEWPDGYVMMGDCITNPQGILWKPLDKLTEAEAEKLRECRETERIAMDAQIASFVQMDHEADQTERGEDA